jgi:hypothetical protein
MVADELRRQADEFIDLTHMVARIGRDPGERAERSMRSDQRRPQSHLVTSAPVGDDLGGD